MKKSTRNLISLSSINVGNSTEKITEENYLRYGQTEDW
jgi:hypothetical protein